MDYGLWTPRGGIKLALLEVAAQYSAIWPAERAYERPQLSPPLQGLAQEVTRLVHGDDGLRAAEVITRSLFDGSVGGLSVTNLMQLEQDGLPSSELDASLLADNSLTSLFVTSDLAKNSKQVKDALMRNAVLVNGAAVGWDMNMEVNKVFSIDNGLHEKWFIVRLGKKSYHLFKLV